MAPVPVSPGQLAWRCRRGMRELDELLSHWLRAGYGPSGPAAQASFQALLELPDPEIAAYLLGRSEPGDPGLRSLLEEIRALQGPAR